MKKIIFLLWGIPVFLSTGTCGQGFYALDTIQKIEILFSQANWDYILDTAKQGSDSYTLAQWVKINDVQFDSAGVKYKGNSSYNPANVKNPLHIELDHFRSQDYLGYKDIKLSNGFHEPSCIREVMLYALLQNYMKASRANFAQVHINGQLMGLYTNTEAVTNTFLDDRFYSNNNTFVFSDNGGCDLRYKGNDSTLYNTPYTLKSDYGLADLMHLCDTLKSHIGTIENILDVDRTLWMIAYTNALVILDSYLGNSKHNYYIYQDHNGRFNPIIWDLNGGMGIFNKLDFGPGLSTLQMQTLSPMAHSNDTMWPLVKNILAVPMYKRMYIAHMKTIIQENIDNGSYYTFAQYLESIVDTAVQSDPNAFYTYAQFLSNINTTVIDGPKIIPGITELMNARAIHLNSTVEFQQVAPVISNITPSDTFPLINSNVFITAAVSNTTAVYLGIRYSVTERFTRMLMYDDGLHGDGSSGDGLYGVSITVSQPEIQYYIYAENSNAGIFSPLRAEHQYYTLNSYYVTLSAGQVVINEIMAVNNATVQNTNGNFGDWIELYNTTSNSVSLDYLNLSDDFSNTTRWQFPNGNIIAPNGFLIVWADNDTSFSEIHCDFGFSGNGEQAILSYANGYVVDSISFPAQTADITWGRYPNGSGPFVFMPPTFNAVNSLTGVDNVIADKNNIRIFPNPSTGRFTISNSQNTISNFKITNVLGTTVFENVLNSKQETLYLNLPGGIYFYQMKDDKQLTSSGKLIVQ